METQPPNTAETDKVCVVMPTVRNPEAIQAYVQNARKHSFPVDRLHVVLVTEDFCDTEAMYELLTGLGVEGRVFGGEARQRWMKRQGVPEYRHLIPEQSHAQTSFGLMYAWHQNFDYVVFLDDDTEPLDTNFFGQHIQNLEFSGEVQSVSSTTGWVNVLHQNHAEHGLYPRGYPYGAMGESIETSRPEVDEVVASQGLWTGVPDLDAVRILNDGDLEGQATTRLSRDDYGENFVAARNDYLTVCSMNLAFKKEVIPAFYQLPMDDNPWGVGRFDDIWSGVFLKHACDVLDKQILNGEPLCRHDKAPRSTFRDLASEAAALELNEHLADILGDAGRGRTSYTGVYRDIARRLIEADADLMNAGFLAYVGEGMLDWLDCLTELAPRDAAPAYEDEIDTYNNV